jgi:hypothetical protein
MEKAIDEKSIKFILTKSVPIQAGWHTCNIGFLYTVLFMLSSLAEFCFEVIFDGRLCSSSSSSGVAMGCL